MTDFSVLRNSNGPPKTTLSVSHILGSTWVFLPGLTSSLSESKRTAMKPNRLILKVSSSAVTVTDDLAPADLATTATVLSRNGERWPAPSATNNGVLSKPGRA